ncbi:TrmO family methyltransferase [Tateyamaria sp. syn59]|uniref:TrmO family methyltransferase domain-containing protein n=1 Tax=Tateyamaria sp. syn59 TaxID=2576942 RepID=UPI0011BE5AF5|nr:TrmO family methyltransferase [Tateyamaria sp. syn59]
MTDTFTLSQIGHTETTNGRFMVRVLPAYREALTGLAEFSHAIALWWAHEADIPDLRARRIIPSPYTATSADFGVFATRSEARPNPIGLSVFSLESVDLEEGMAVSHYFDMLPSTPILDLKPYFPASDLVIDAGVPAHFKHWPASVEASADFDWQREFRD